MKKRKIMPEVRASLNNMSTRAKVVYARTYSRPSTKHGIGWGAFETFQQTVDRVIEHQRWLWVRARGSELGKEQEQELEDLRTLMYERKVMLSGRTLWLGGTEVSKRREASQFNCAFLRAESIHDIVDAYWLLLQGCGVGFEPVVGTLSGFTKPLRVEIIRSKKTDPKDKGREGNYEHEFNGEWYISVGDSAEAWAKLPGKLLANKKPCKKLTIDFSEIRPAGTRLANYGWISSGDNQLADAILKITDILNTRADMLLTRLDIMDILNLLGSTLSSRRSAEITLVPYGDPEWAAFATAKMDLEKTPWRTQSNNSLVFWHKPTRHELENIFQVMIGAGGSEPGFINGVAAKLRAPWFKGVNPCGEILLGSHCFCNLVTTDLAKFNGDFEGLQEAIRLVSRANYRQTCVNLDDGILQRRWHELNEFLRLQGVSLTGIARWEFRENGSRIRQVRNTAGIASYNMADELGLPRSKAITTIKPEGTLSKLMDTTEGLHSPKGAYVFNNINFGASDPLLPALRDANYHLFPNPYNPEATIARLPVAFPECSGDPESAVDQLDRYKLFMENYVEHNASITVTYDLEEVSQIIDWLDTNWHVFVGVTFILRKDSGYAYLPQEAVSKEFYEAYVSTLKPLVIAGSSADHDEPTIEELGLEDCAGGQCPIR